jgi:3'-phosphoadenosine 5'-phosphosulfate sulfotransferase (PAPS reductase)/FAD synthetase
MEQIDIKELVDGLNFAQKVERSLDLVRRAYEEYGDRLVVANSLGKDSCVVWDLPSVLIPKFGDLS